MRPLTSDDHDVLDNLVWHALTTTHAPFAIGDGLARRYPADVTVFAAMARDDHAAWGALRSLAGADETLVIFRAGEIVPSAGWTRTWGGLGNQMVFDQLGAHIAIDAPIVPLGVEHVAEMLSLIEIAQPGPFCPRTIELGNYYGVFDNGSLIAMAGERLQTPRFTEVSAVCTHPSARGQGLASALTHRVAAGILERDQIPILHVAQSNVGAQRVYERLGFAVRRAVAFTAIRPPT